MKQGKSKVVAALSITILIFIAGFTLGNISLSSKIGAVQDLQNEIYTESLRRKWFTGWNIVEPSLG